ncbi:hypothetical protein GCM10028820_32560 [Tessaracoccus terricola]
MNKKFVVALAVGALVCAANVSPAHADPTEPAEGFRIYPYLLAPSSTSMQLNWVSETDTAGTATVTGPGLPDGGVQLTSAPEYLPLAEYTEAELAQEIDGLEQGSWLKANTNYRHIVDVAGLQPGEAYEYTVEQGGEEFTRTFRTAPTAEDWDHIRIAAFSDSETEPYGRTEQREWELSFTNPYTEGSAERPGEGSDYVARHGSTTRYDQFTLRYPMDQDRAMQENMRVIEEQDPDLMIIAGDLSQGSGYQPAWDEFFGYVAGEHGTLASQIPFLTAVGNWETFAALNGGYGTDEDRSPAVISRNKYLDYWTHPVDPENPAARGSYYRADHGPLTVLTLDSTNGRPDESAGDGSLPTITGDDTELTPENLSTDTQGEFTYDAYAAAYQEVFPGSTADDVDLPNMDPASRQWEWAQEQLADAAADGQIIIVQFHHAAYSIGVHGVPPNHAIPDNQSGVAMRAYTPMFEEHGVSVVLSGHDEMFERSWVDEDGDGEGFHSYDIGVAADGLRGELMVPAEGGGYEPLAFNTATQWSAVRDQPETWELVDGRPQLVDGGLHYGHLQIDITRNGDQADVVLTPVYLFPHLDEDYDVVSVERRIYDDVVEFSVDLPDTPTEEPSPEPSEEPSPEPTPDPTPPGDLYTTPGLHDVNGRRWMTVCEPYSQTTRCFTYIWATQIHRSGDQYFQLNQWAFNNLTYVAAPKALWADNPLANPGEWVAADGRRWRTECNTPATGGNGCRSYAEASVVERTGTGFRTVTKMVFNNIVRFK